MACTPELDMLIGYHLRRASNVMMADLSDRLSELKLNTTEASILVVLDASPTITQSDIGRHLAIKRANMAPLIATLIARDLITQGEPVGRRRPLTLSDKGRALAAKARTKMKNHDASFFGALSVEYRHQLHSMLERLWQDRLHA